MKDKPRPIHEVRLGFVKAAIWKNETDAGPRYNATVSRLYKDKDVFPYYLRPFAPVWTADTF